MVEEGGRAEGRGGADEHRAPGDSHSGLCHEMDEAELLGLMLARRRVSVVVDLAISS